MAKNQSTTAKVWKIPLAMKLTHKTESIYPSAIFLTLGSAILDPASNAKMPPQEPALWVLKFLQEQLLLGKVVPSIPSRVFQEFLAD